MDQWVGQWVGSGQMTNVIKFELIDLILFEDTYGWMSGLMGGLMSNHQNQINLDLFEIIQLWTFFWTFYLNHLSRLWGYFLHAICMYCIAMDRMDMESSVVAMT